MVDDGDGDDGVGGAGPEGEREAVRPHGEEAAVAADPHEVLAKVTADLESVWLHDNQQWRGKGPYIKDVRTEMEGRG